MESRTDFASQAARAKRWLCGAVALTALGLGSGCSKTDSKKPVSAASGSEEKVVVVLTWDEYFNDEVLAEFTNNTGIKVEKEYYLSTAEMLEKLRSNPQKYDLVIAEEMVVPQMKIARLVKNLDRSQLPNLKNIDPEFLNRPFDQGNEISVPYTWGTTLLAYRKDLLPELPSKSWKVLLDPKVKDKVSLLDERNECFAMAMRVNQVANMKEATDQEVTEATAFLDRLIREQGARLGSDNQMKEHLIDGSSWVAQMYSGDAALIAQEEGNPPIGYFIPEEGAVIWIDNFLIPADSIRPRNAHEFLNFMMEPKSAALTANFLRYASPNKAAEPLIDEDLKSDTTIYPLKELLAKCSALPYLKADLERNMNRGWNNVHRAHDVIHPPKATADAPPDKAAAPDPAPSP